MDHLERRKCVLAGHKILALQLLAAAGRELHTEVRQSLVPGARNTQLPRTIFHRHALNRVELPGRGSSLEEFRLRLNPSVIGDAALQPDLIERCVAPVGEETNTI